MSGPATRPVRRTGRAGPSGQQGGQFAEQGRARARVRVHAAGPDVTEIHRVVDRGEQRDLVGGSDQVLLVGPGRVAQAPRALHDQDRHVRAQRSGRWRSRESGPEQHQRPLRSQQELGDLPGLAADHDAARALHGRRRQVAHGDGRPGQRRIVRHRCGEDVRGQFQVHGARRERGGPLPGPAQQRRQLGRVGAPDRGLAQVPGQPGLLEFLEGAHAVLGVRVRGAEQDHRHLGQPRAGQRGERAGESGACADQVDAGLARGSGPAFGHVPGAAFVPGVHQRHVPASERVDQRQVLVAGNHEHGGLPVAVQQRLGQGVGSGAVGAAWPSAAGHHALQSFDVRERTVTGRGT